MYCAVCLLCLVSLFTLGTSNPMPDLPSVPLGGKCTPGQSYKLDCNTCFCNNNGEIGGCTIMACAHLDAPSIELLLDNLEEAPSDGTCQPGKMYKKDCNTCGCTEEGTLGICTLKACPKQRRSIDDLPSVPLDGRCVPGESYKLDCNTCICNDQGEIGACSLQNCDEQSLEDLESLPPVPLEGQCRPGKSYRKDCNTCICNPDGTIGLCTMKFCGKVNKLTVGLEILPEVPTNGRCTPGQNYRLDCNTCTCNDEGMIGACTMLNCDETDMIVPDTDIIPDVPEDGKCTPGQNYRLDCNTCTCNDDGVIDMCTMKFCDKTKTSLDNPDNLPAVPKDGKCTPGRSYRLDCNTCICNSNGEIGACTLKACSDYIHSKRSATSDDLPELPEKCTPGKSYKQDCNTCICGVDGVAACSEMACDRKKRNDELQELPADGKCEPGKSYKQDCNTCVCGSDGQPACTYKLCYRSKRSANQFDAPALPVPQDGSCIPGMNYKMDCNTCICNDDGRIGACTQMMCPRYKRNSNPSDDLPELPADGKCQPGRSYKQDCNTCVCGADGQPACTYKMCYPSKRSANQFDEPALPVPQDGSCIPGMSYKMDCNTCICNKNGRIGACTAMMCPRNRRAAAFLELEAEEETNSDRRRRAPEACYSGEFKQDACNTCRCVSGGWACTRKFCGPSYGEPIGFETRGYRGRREADDSCKVGEVKRVSCNSCTCVQGSEDSETLWVCTKKGCLHDIEKPVMQKRDVAIALDLRNTPCAPNDFFQIDCNNCFCNNARTGYVCSERICPISSPSNTTPPTISMDDLSENSTLYNKTGGRSIMLTINNRKVNLPVNSTIINGTIVSNPMFSTPGYGLVQNKNPVNVTNLIEESARSSDSGTEIIEEILTGTINDAKRPNGTDNISVLRPSGNSTTRDGDALEQQ